MQEGSITYITSHGYIKVGGPLVIIISVPEMVYSGEMTGHDRVLCRAPGLDGAEQALFCAMS
jgi:hypothetical protein